MVRESDITPGEDLPPAIESILETGRIATLVTIVDGVRSIGSKLLICEDGAVVGSWADPALQTLVVRASSSFLESRQETRTIDASELDPQVRFEAKILLLFERIAPEPRLFICGAGHVGAALAKIGPTLGFKTTVIDDRPDLLATLDTPKSELALRAITNWSASVTQAISNGRGAYVAIVTRGHREDEDCLSAVLRLKPDYVGMIGSRRRTNIVLDRLRAAGVADAELREVRAPIGLDIGAVTPAEVALAIAAEIVAERRGGLGASLSAWRRH